MGVFGGHYVTLGYFGPHKATFGASCAILKCCLDHLRLFSSHFSSLEQPSQVKSNHGLTNIGQVKPRVKHGLINFDKSSLKSNQVTGSQIWSGQVSSQVKSSQTWSSQPQVKSQAQKFGQVKSRSSQVRPEFGQVIKSSRQVKRLGHRKCRSNFRICWNKISENWN